MSTLDLGPATTDLTELVRSVGDDDLTRPTPCTEYSVGDLVDHLGGLALAFTGAARKEPVPGAEEGGSGDASRLEPGWRERIAADLASLAEAWRGPAAYDGMTVAGPVEMPGEVAAVVALNEVVVHGWDLATARRRWSSFWRCPAAAADRPATSIGAIGRALGQQCRSPVIRTTVAARMQDSPGFGWR